VGDDDAVAPFHEVGYVAAGLDNGGVLVRHAHVLVVLDERISANGNDHSFHIEPVSRNEKIIS
jgi:hypothetical protein